MASKTTNGGGSQSTNDVLHGLASEIVEAIRPDCPASELSGKIGVVEQLLTRRLSNAGFVRQEKIGKFE